MHFNETSTEITISIIIPCYKLEGLNNILDSISSSKYNKYEIILINCNNLNLKEMEQKYLSSNIKIISNAFNENPINIGISNATSEIILIQNQNYYHVGDIITFINNNINEDNCLIFKCLNLNKDDSIKFINSENKNLENIRQINENSNMQHLDYYSIALHKKYLEILGKFDKNLYFYETYLHKLHYNCNLNVTIVDSNENMNMVNLFDDSLNDDISLCDNKNINELLKKNIDTKFMYPKILHLFWYGALPFLNFITILSFHRYHPDWLIIVYTSTNANTINKGGSEQRPFKCVVKDYFPILEKMEYVNIINTDKTLKKLQIENIYMVHQADILRMYVLIKYGGVYSDFDIIYIRNLEEYFADKNTSFVFKCICKANSSNIYYPGGFFISNRNCLFYKFIMEKQLEYVKKGIEKYNSVGPDMMKKICTGSDFSKFENTVEVLNSNCFLPYEWFHMIELYKSIHDWHEKSFGVHWFNGASDSKEYIENFDINNIKNDCTISKFVNEYVAELKLEN